MRPFRNRPKVQYNCTRRCTSTAKVPTVPTDQRCWPRCPPCHRCRCHPPPPFLHPPPTLRPLAPPPPPPCPPPPPPPNLRTKDYIDDSHPPPNPRTKDYIKDSHPTPPPKPPPSMNPSPLDNMEDPQTS